MVLKTDYDRQLWTGLSTDDWGDVPVHEGDVVYLMDLSECYIFGESQVYQLPDLGGGGGGSVMGSVGPLSVTNQAGSVVSIFYNKYFDTPDYIYANTLSFSNNTNKVIYELMTYNGFLWWGSNKNNLKFTYNGNTISELITQPMQPSGNATIYKITPPANYDINTPILIEII